MRALTRVVPLAIITTGCILGLYMGSRIVAGMHPTQSCPYSGGINSSLHYYNYTLTENDPGTKYFAIRTSPNSMGWGFGYDTDPDCDGLTSYEEWFIVQSFPHDPDYDNDGIDDGNEIAAGTNPFSNEGVDVDGDGVSNIAEILNGSLPRDPDSDDDGLMDYEELVTYHTNPMVADSDYDGLTDPTEISVNANPLDPDTDNDGMGDKFEYDYWLLDPLVDDSTGDVDGDSLSNLAEYIAGTNPQNKDSDGDGLNDHDELAVYGTNPLRRDTDGDGESDAAELANGTNPLDPNSSTAINESIKIITIAIAVVGSSVVATISIINLYKRSKERAYESHIRALDEEQRRRMERRARMQAERKQARLDEARKLCDPQVSGPASIPSRSSASKKSTARATDIIPVRGELEKRALRNAAPEHGAKSTAQHPPRPVEAAGALNRTVLKEYVERQRKEGVRELHYIGIKNDLGIISQKKSAKLYRILQDLVKGEILVRKGSNYIIVG